MIRPSFKKIAILSTLVYLFSAAVQAQNMWAWMKGSNTANSLGSYGTQGVASPSNNPPARYEASEWTDNNGKFWLYGGYETVNNNQYNDLWMYDPATNMWTWMNGPNTPNNNATYGTQGVPAPTNNPGPRKYGSVTWVDQNNNLWLLGGFGPLGIMNDLWEYNMGLGQWVWMKGVNTGFPSGSYGTQGVPSMTNEPSYRCECSASWVSNNGDLWFFGGQGNGDFNDLWRYNISSNEWTWMSGSQFGFAAGNWGTQGVPAPTNVPSGRFIYASWKDLTGNFWLFGGNDSSFFSGGGMRNDLWKYDLSTGFWTWISGSNAINQPGVYGTQCVPSTSNIPGGRIETRSRWVDDCGNFWLFAGATDIRGALSHNDLWKYNPTSNQWTWVSGSTLAAQTGVYGVQTVPAAGNHPGARMGAVAWRNKSGLFFFGGASGGNTSYYNDLWKYIPDKPTAAFTPNPTTGCAPLIVNFNNTSTPNCSDIKDYSWNFGDPPSGPANTSILTNPTHTFTTVGTYTIKLVVESCLGIKDSITHTVSVTPGFTAAATSTAAGCTTSTGTATATPTSGTGPFTYSWSNGGNTQTINNLAAGTYTCTITETGGCTYTLVDTVHTNSTPPVTSAITGPGTICPNATGMIYSVTNSVGSTYNWTVPGGATITAGQGTNSITVNFGATGGTITCTETNSCGTGTPVTYNVVIGSSPVTSPITGTSPVCPNAVGIVYSVVNTPGSTYAWTVPGGATITAGQGTNSITVNWGTTGGTITCTETSSCGTGAPVTFNVTIGTVPNTSPISGTSPVCANATNVVYTVNNTAGSTYSWTVPSGATIVSGQGTNSIIVNWGTSGGTITCTETSSCGTGAPVTYPVTVNPLPTTSPITGTNPVCASATGVVYSVTNTPGSTYNWTVPTGATITAGQGTNSITVNWGSTGGTITCTETNSCGSGAPVTYSVSFTSLPVTSAITGPTPVCPSQAGTVYTVTNNAGSTYSWSVPPGAIIASGQGTNSITVNWGSSGGNVICIETNVCGNGNPVSITVVMGSLPVTGPITGVSPLCPNAVNTAYSVPNTPGSTYTWTVPAGASIVSGQTTNSILVNWGTTGGSVSVTETNACGNGTPVTFTVVVDPMPLVHFTGDSLQGCSPLTVHFTDQSTITAPATITAWHWSFGDGNVSTSQNGVNTYLNPGAYNVTLTVTTNAGCTATFSAPNYINIFPNPEADFSSTPGLTVNNPVDQFTDQSTGAVTWSWNFGDGGTSTQQNPSHTYGDAGTYPVLLIVKNNYGCLDSMLKDIVIKDEFTFYVPNAFTPNGDGVNDTFQGIGRGIASYEMWIFDRWGELIYISESYNQPWDGRRNTGITSNQLVQQDVYVYKINVTDIFGTAHYYIGSVTVVK